MNILLEYYSYKVNPSIVFTTKKMPYIKQGK